MNPIKIGIILNTNDAETCWNCFRFGNTALKRHSVRVFLLGSGVEAEGVKDERFPLLAGAIEKFVSNGGIILACGTCLRQRLKEGSGICSVSTMEGLLSMVEESERLVTFG